MFARLRRAAAAGGGAGGFTVRPRRHLLDLLRAPRRPEPRQAARGRDLETEVQLSLRAGDGRHRGLGHGAEAGDLHDLRRHRRQARAPRRSSARAAAGAASTPRARASSRSASPARSAAAAAQIIESPCETCGGSGLTMQRKRYRVKVPAGVRDGSRIRVAGKGEDGPRGGPPGDLYVVTRVDALAGLQAARRRQPRGDGPDHDRRGDPGRDGRGPDAQRHEADPDPRRDPARHRPAAARRGAAEAAGRGPRRHPLPARDRGAAGAHREQQRGARRVRRRR